MAGAFDKIRYFIDSAVLIDFVREPKGYSSEASKAWPSSALESQRSVAGVATPLRRAKRKKMRLVRLIPAGGRASPASNGTLRR